VPKVVDEQTADSQSPSGVRSPLFTVCCWLFAARRRYLSDLYRETSDSLLRVMTTDTFPAIPQTPPPPPPAPTKRKGGFAKKAFFALLILAVVGVFGAIGYVKWTEGKIDRIPSEELASLATVVPGSSEPLNFLIIATDDRSDLPEDWEDNFGEFAGRRTDVMMLAHVVPGERIQLLSLPRDLQAEIEGHGINRLNAAFVFGGPDLLIKTVQEETGIPVHHYVEIDFGGFGRIVDSLGGVTIDFPYPARDGKSGFEVEAGTHTLDGEMAVAYARSRTYEEYIDGSWQGTGGGDIARTQRQQDIMVQLFDQVASPSSAFNLPTFLPTFADNITADEALGLALMTDLARSALGLQSSSIDRVTLPVKNHKGSDGRAYVIPTDEAPIVIAAFKAGDPYP
jgi:LCP family protein required for cell wall assembly